ncbi:maleylpyruvate isomerase N-terminal domain-containing protein [Amycolatopsis pithecellobii]|uniref:maleylpyruvate isomerase N-terminal domain-containing protein n=1 Tax=Amycolatopsis pithecellobii TaxID=664692 RepID=UPI001AA07372
MAAFDQTVHLIKADQWDNLTPCSEWTVRDLVNHLVPSSLGCRTCSAARQWPTSGPPRGRSNGWCT